MEKIQDVSTEEILKEALEALSQASDSTTLYQVKVRYLGRNGKVTQLMKSLREISSEKRREFGKKINELKEKIENDYNQKLEKFKNQEILNLSQNQLDLTLPTPQRLQGSFHPIENMIQKTLRIFTRMGYMRVSGPLIETDWYNFSALNIPPDHPSRDNQDTFYLDSKHLLRTHTSPVQIRSLERLKPPLAIVAPGPVFRRDQVDSSHSPHFHQIEGLLVDRKVSMSHLKGTLSYFLKELYGSSVRIRFRPSFFPFTEPSAEYDTSCFLCRSQGCSLCKRSTWIEMGGCGLVHPQVLKASEVNPDEWQGFAFGMGVDRLTLLEYGVSDIRYLYENRIDFLNQFENIQGF